MMRTICVAGLMLLLLPPFAARGQSADEPAGIAAAINTTAQGFPPARPMQTLVIGSGVVTNERIDTDEAGQAQFLFRDGSTFTVSENASVVIDRFAYDPEAQRGDLSMSLTRGVFRFVGGKLSKDGAVQFTTPTALLTVRGGIALIDVAAEGQTQATFLYGDQLTVTAAGKTEIIKRPGYQVTVDKGAAPAPARKAAASYVSGTLQHLAGKPATTAGAAQKPTPVVVAKALATPPKSPPLAALVAKAPQPSRAADQQAAAAKLPAVVAVSGSPIQPATQAAPSASPAAATRPSPNPAKSDTDAAKPSKAKATEPPKPKPATGPTVGNQVTHVTAKASQQKTVAIVHPKVTPTPVTTTTTK